MFVDFTGFSPDQNLDVAGGILDGTSFIPTTNGIGAFPSPVSAGYPALGSACQGAVAIRKVDDTKRIFAATQTALYEASGTTYTDQSKGGGYTGSSDGIWRFAQFGNDTIATNLVDPVQVSTSSTFADLAGTPPKASIVEVCEGFVMLFDYDDGVNHYNDGWWCSALRNDASWTPSIATQAANGRLLDTPGSIRAGKALGNIMVAYKERSMYLGFYDGAPVIWRWQLQPGEIGAVSQEAVVNVLINGSPAHIFAGYDDIYIFDGSRAVSIGNKVLKQWYNSNSSTQYRYRTKSMHDRVNQIVYFFLPDSTGKLTKALAFNYTTGQFGKISTGLNVQAALEYLVPGITYEGLGTAYSTYNDIPVIAYDSPFWTSGSPVIALFDSTNTLQTMTGTPGTSQFQVSYVGDPEIFQTLIRARPKFNLFPLTAKGSLITSQNLGDDTSATANKDMNSGKIDFYISSRWFSISYTLTGDFEATGHSLFFEAVDGTE